MLSPKVPYPRTNQVSKDLKTLTVVGETLDGVIVQEEDGELYYASGASESIHRIVGMDFSSLESATIAVLLVNGYVKNDLKDGAIEGKCINVDKQKLLEKPDGT